jgi:GAF domain-containing protein
MLDDRDPRADREAALLAFAVFALRAAGTEETITQSVEVTTRTLPAPIGAVLQYTDQGTAVVRHSQGPTPVTPGDALSVDEGNGSVRLPCAGGTLAENPSAEDPAGRSKATITGSVSANVSAAIQVEGRRWGQLLACDPQPRTFTQEDATFVRMVAALLGAALERERRAGEDAALAGLRRYAAESQDLAAVMDRAVDAAMHVARAPVGAVVRIPRARPGSLTLIQKAGQLNMPVGLDYTVDPMLTEALGEASPLMVEDWRTDGRFATPPFPPGEGTVAALAAAIVLDGRPWGSLIVGDVVPRQFDERTVETVSSAAALLAAALQRKRKEWDKAAEALLPSLPPARPAGQATEVALLDPDGVIVWVNEPWQHFCRDNAGDPSRAGVGVSYLEVCDAARDPVANQVAEAIRAAAQGFLPAPMTVVIPCHSPHTARWFDVLISSRLDDGGRSIGVTVTISPADR